MYDYQLATSRNIGWVTESEQQLLKNKRVAIAGLGGVGGAHAIMLARLGVGRFHLSDFDEYEIHNFNRQIGANMQTIGRPKLDVIREQVLSINPEAEIRVFPEGIGAENVEQFLDGVDLYVDSLDFFVMEARKTVFRACHQRQLPAITAAPLGMGCAFLAFTPDSMSFDDYFGFEGLSERDQLIRFLVGLAPTVWQRHYLVDKSTADFDSQKGPSTPMAVDLCAGIAGTNALKLLLGRGTVVKAPKGMHVDAYLNRSKVTWRPGGYRNPLQQVAFAVARKVVGKS
ncbi:ThiF family adenylyltransferase [Motiliproteus coralliicola]|uniref:ThiF family adenylyltransferase n=1 Tax=Motiliproteus coralliicola TaxID=2283196 RepID=A0A369WSX5_9GAMM|nr:ThiF family adenylyltransferase [Motiliproteus coralliicola]RDE24792.1 ThiF family adenylyltransferase [Motiliproteus coralliicola]